MFRNPKDKVIPMATQTAARLATEWPINLEESLRHIPEVVAAFASRAGGSLRIIVFVDNFTDEIVGKVLDIEDSFAELYRHGGSFLFDVLAVPKSGSPADVVPGATQIYFNPAAA